MLNVQVMADYAPVSGGSTRHDGNGAAAVIINVSSISAFFPSPGDVNYPASKAYLNVFSQALQAEVLDSGIIVQALCPGFTVTEFHDTEIMTEFNREKVPSVLWMTAEQVVSHLPAFAQSKPCHLHSGPTVSTDGRWHKKRPHFFTIKNCPQISPAG